ncbi:MAG: DUF2505 domain-containing protein [Rhodobacteraceae bacterium]|nr:DUF2505 domain-containing protein [Paracoccaceae bacterium]
MKLTVTLTYAAPPSQIGRMLVDEEFQRQVCSATGDAQARVSVLDSADGAKVRTSRRLPTDRLPDAMRALVGHHIIVVQSTRWPGARTDAGWTGTVVVAVEGKPVRLEATATVVPSAGGTTITYSGDLVAHIPFLGGKVERAVEPIVRSALEAEQRVGAQWLEGAPG